jgi:hypothetical protein
LTLEQDIAHFEKTFSVDNGGYGPGINWYRAQLLNVNEADERGIFILAFSKLQCV